MLHAAAGRFEEGLQYFLVVEVLQLRESERRRGAAEEVKHRQQRGVRGPRTAE
jgi:hypothetical protein